ncbi:hypothetical protein UO65_4238 [Actinokineospora spheciospongiae]|uniref:Uncharacterized protein n=1 Tax=Actinokineospora spheciospongiae TaxID=909613 RepID=W7IVL9_9PSEU|nr:hypothetical protein UO65_4238 [Actinokineospora spheciospongiae]
MGRASASAPTWFGPPRAGSTRPTWSWWPTPAAPGEPRRGEAATGAAWPGAGPGRVVGLRGRTGVAWGCRPGPRGNRPRDTRDDITGLGGCRPWTR